MRVLMIDNYDSCTYNLVQYLQELGPEVLVHRNTWRLDPPDPCHAKNRGQAEGRA